MSDKTFVTGLYFKKPSPKAPDFVLGNLSAKREELITFLELQQGEWVNMSVKESKQGKVYIELDTWKPNQSDDKGIKRTGEPVYGDDGQEVPF